MRKRTLTGDGSNIPRIRIGYVITIGLVVLRAPTRSNHLVPTPRFCHVKDVRSGHRAILKKGALCVVELVDFWVAVEFLGVGAMQYPSYCKFVLSQFGAWAKSWSGTRCGRSAIPGP